MAKGTGMIGAAEELLWPAERVRSDVGIIYPRSSHYWDEQDVELPRGIMDCTNTHMTAGPDYLREVYSLWRTLSTVLNFGVEFLDEDELLAPASLAKFKVLYLTEPDLPLAGGAALLAWVKAGGTLVTVAGAGGFDEFDEPSATFQTGLLGRPEAPKTRSITAPLLTANGTLNAPLPGSFATNGTSCSELGGCTFQAWGMITKPGGSGKAGPDSAVLASFDDKSPAIEHNRVGKGNSVHFYFFPGTSSIFGYTANVTGHRGPGGLASDWTLRAVLWNITTKLGGAMPSVRTNSLEVETPLLAGPTGSVVTLLNWAHKEFNTSTGLLHLNVTLGFKPSKIESVEHGPIVPMPTAGSDGTVSLGVPLSSADFLLFHK
eukprot:SAG31_NODE_916_length_11047_cov_3.507033_10_plen_375_part_00